MSGDPLDVSDGGERVVPLVKDWNYYSHLSVYRFAVPHLRGLRVVDAGCGTGYGAAYLRQHGAAHVIGVDVSEKALEFARAHFAADGLAFQQADLSAGLPFASDSVDAIFSSQAMEHLADIEHFMDECRRVLRSSGLMIVAVPAIASARQLEENIWNRYHVTNLTPLGWYSKTRRRFRRVASFSHWPKPPYAGWERIAAGLRLAPEQTTIRETDFDTLAVPIASLNSSSETLNTVLLARRPRWRVRPPEVAEFVPHAWQEGALHAKVRREATELLRWQLHQAEQRLAEVRGDTPSPDGT